MARAYYATQTNRTLNIGEQPNLSHNLEAFRAYSWEVEIDSGIDGDDSVLTLAAKQVTQPGMTSEDIVVDRVNDKFYYPGKVTPEEITITFDNLVKDDVSTRLFDWFSTTYDPVHGVFTPNFTQGVGSFKRNIKIYQLDNTQFPVKHLHLYGAFPKSWKPAEFNYSTNEFHTIEVTLRYDFPVQYTGLD